MTFASVRFLLPLPAFIALGLICAMPTRAEDPLLGRIKVIQCVGCTPGSVDLVVHDPIDVRDFHVRINESDYQKIVTPLTGKTVYDKAGCFYWMDVPKVGAKPSAAKATAASAVDPAKDALSGKGGKKSAATSADSATAPAPGDGLVDAASPAPTPEIQGTPSKCIPYVRVEFKPARKTGKEEE